MRNMQCSKLLQLDLDFCSSPRTRPKIISKSQTPKQSKFPYQSYDQNGSPITSLLSPSVINHSNVSYPYYMPESRFAYRLYTDFDDDVPVAAPPVMKARIIGEANEEVEEIIRGILDLFRRLPSSSKDKVAMKILKTEMSNKNGLNVGSASTTVSTRAIVGQLEDSSTRLERFKVKTVTVGGVIKDDKKK